MTERTEEIKITLEPDEVPRKWYNIQADLPEALAPQLNPGTKEPVGPADLSPLFPMELIRQEVSRERYEQIPDEVREALIHIGRPSPLYRARNLEKHLKTPARIYYKREDTSFTGSHKTNTAIAQAYYNMKEGVGALTTETGAGQWGTALSLAGSMFGLDIEIFMVGSSYRQKPYRRIIMEMYGGKVHSSPSKETEFGRKILAQNGGTHSGSLGIAISEAIELAVISEGRAKYSLGSVLNHVLMHQSVIGLETMAQFEKIDTKPDIMIGCVGGGSNFAGFTYPAIGSQLRGGGNGIRFVAVEPEVCPTLTKGELRYDHGDAAGMTPLMMMYTLGHEFVPNPIHAGGLRYHGVAPSLSLLRKLGLIEAVSYNQLETFEAGRVFARTEGLVAAPESTHAIKAAIDEALVCRKTGEEKVIAFNLSGHGMLDLAGYESFMNGELA